MHSDHMLGRLNIEINSPEVSKKNSEIEKVIIETAIKVPLNDIIQTFIDDPENAIKALNAVIKNTPVDDDETLKEVLGSIQEIQKILNHKYPQNTAESYAYNAKFLKKGYAVFKLEVNAIDAITPHLLLKNGRIISKKNYQPYYHDDEETQLAYILAREKEGLLSLTTRVAFDKWIKKDDVVAYIKACAEEIIEQFDALKNLIPFIKQHKKDIQALLLSCDTLTIDQFPHLGKQGLKKILGHPIAISRLFDVLHIPIKTFITLNISIRAEFIQYALPLMKLHEASISWHEILILPKATRKIFYDQAQMIAKLITTKQTTFNELKEMAHARPDLLLAYINMKNEETNKQKPLPQVSPYPFSRPPTPYSRSTISAIPITPRNSRTDILPTSAATLFFNENAPTHRNLDRRRRLPQNLMLLRPNLPPPIELECPRNLWWIEHKTLILAQGNIVIGFPYFGLKMINPDDGEILLEYKKEGLHLNILTELHNGYVAGFAHAGENIFIFDLHAQKLVLTIPHHENTTKLFSLDKYLITFGMGENAMTIYDSETGQFINHIAGMHLNHSMLLVKNHILLMGSNADYNNLCQLIEPLTGKVLHEYKLKKYTIGIGPHLLLPNGNLVIADMMNDIYIYDLNDPRHDLRVKKICVQHLSVLRSLALSEGGHLLIGDCYGNVSEYHYTTGKRLHAFRCDKQFNIASPIALQLLFKHFMKLYTSPEAQPRWQPGNDHH